MQQRVQEFLSALWAGGQASYWWTAQDSRSHWFNVGEQWRALPDDNENDIYFGVNPCKFIPARPSWSRTRLASIAQVNALYCDFDNRREIPDGILQPSVVISSGNGLHCYWLLRHPITMDSDDSLAYAKYVQRWWVHSLPDADRGVCCLTRILRLPDTYNHKDVSTPKPVVVRSMDIEMQYTIAEMEIPPMPPSPKYVAVEINRVYTGDEGQRLAQSCYDKLAHAVSGDRNKQCYSQAYFMGRLFGGGLISGDDATALLIDAATCNGVGRERPEDTARSIRRGMREGAKDPYAIGRRMVKAKRDWDQ